MGFFLNGYKVFESNLLTKTTITRVKGGYLNRWWVRQVVVEPDRRIVISKREGLIFCHPVIAQEIRRVSSASFT